MRALGMSHHHRTGMLGLPGAQLIGVDGAGQGTSRRQVGQHAVHGGGSGASSSGARLSGARVFRSCAMCASGSSSQSTSTGVPPWATTSRAVAAPMPEAAPVIKTTRDERGKTVKAGRFAGLMCTWRSNRLGDHEVNNRQRQQSCNGAGNLPDA